jgi:hypothetical protein
MKSGIKLDLHALIYDYHGDFELSYKSTMQR